MDVFPPCAYFVLGWRKYPNYCSSATNEPVLDIYHAAGNADVDACTSECSKMSKCSAIEWYENLNGVQKCFLILSDVPALKGFTGFRHLDAACYIRPVNGKMSQRNEII